jgi:hypothetical protein
MKPKVETYIDLLSMKDAGVKPKFTDMTDEQLMYFCVEEELIDSEIAYLYNATTEEVRIRRYSAYINQLRILQEKLLQDHFIVKSANSDDKDISSIKSDKTKEIITQIHSLSNAELDELMDYLILNNKRLAMATIKP